MVSSLLLVALGLPPVQKAPVKAFVLSGQSNMVGHGFVMADPKRNGGKGSLEQVARDPATGGKFKHLLNKDGSWRVRDDVFIHYFDRKGALTVGYGAGPDCIGPELGFGSVVGDSIREPVLLIKIAWGGKSLARDFRPPSSGGTVGPYYGEVVRHTREVLANVGAHFPEWKGRPVQLVGFGWHQGWNDRINADFVREYEQNMANFIRDIRKDLAVPNLPFVIAETGMGDDADRNQLALALRRAQAAVAQHEDLRSNVAFVGTRSFWRTADQSPSDQGYHWNSSGETYYLIGDAMGHAMLGLLKRDRAAGGPNGELVEIRGFDSQVQQTTLRRAIRFNVIRQNVSTLVVRSSKQPTPEGVGERRGFGAPAATWATVSSHRTACVPPAAPDWVVDVEAFGPAIAAMFRGSTGCVTKSIGAELYRQNYRNSPKRPH